MHARHRLAIVAVAGAAALSTGAAVAGGTAACVQVEVTSPDAPIKFAAPRFSVSKTLDLTLTAVFKSDFSGDHVLDLDIFTPDGHLYRSMAVPIAAPGQLAGKRSVNGFPRPMPQAPLRPFVRARTSYLAVDVPFPVAGTDIVSSALYGRWQVQARLDGQRNPCAQASTFTLTQ